VLAAAARLLDVGFFRIGGEEYAEANDSYGLTTMRRDHVQIDGAVVVFDYRAKSGRQRLQAVADPEVMAVVARPRSSTCSPGRPDDAGARTALGREPWLERRRIILSEPDQCVELGAATYFRVVP
jgi:hypothetical protein